MGTRFCRLQEGGTLIRRGLDYGAGVYGLALPDLLPAGNMVAVQWRTATPEVRCATTLRFCVRARTHPSCRGCTASHRTCTRVPSSPGATTYLAGRAVCSLCGRSVPRYAAEGRYLFSRTHTGRWLLPPLPTDLRWTAWNRFTP